MTSSAAPGPTVILVGCARLPQGEDDGRGLAPALASRGCAVRWESWDDASVDWLSADVVVLRATWDYTTRLPEFLAWAARVPHLVNPAAVVRWSSEKTYLRDLATAGVPVIPTVWAEPGQDVDLPDEVGRLGVDVDVVVKPTVGAGSRGARRDPPCCTTCVSTPPRCTGTASPPWCSRTCHRSTPKVRPP